MTREQALAFVRQHGIASESSRGRLPNFIDAALDTHRRGSWWGHPRAGEAFWLTRAIRESPDVLVCRLAGGKITYVHRRLWPALVRLADRFDARALAAIHEIHTPSGKHVVEEVPFPRWVPRDVRERADELSEADAMQTLEQLLALPRGGKTASQRNR